MHLHLNLHRPSDAEVPFFALVDDALFDVLSTSRWNTGPLCRPVRMVYDPAIRKARSQSLAQKVWELCGEPPAKVGLGHVNGDPLDCRRSNLVSLRARGAGFNAAVRSFESPDVVAYRKASGIPVEGLPAPKGRPSEVSPEQAETLRELRETVGAELSLSRFNREIVAAEIGRPLSWNCLKKLLA